MTKQFEVRAYTYADAWGEDYRDYGRFDAVEKANEFIAAKLAELKEKLVEMDGLEDDDKQYMMDVAKEAYHVVAVVA